MDGSKCDSCDWQGKPYFLAYSKEEERPLLVHANTPTGLAVCRWCGKSLGVWHPDH